MVYVAKILGQHNILIVNQIKWYHFGLRSFDFKNFCCRMFQIEKYVPTQTVLFFNTTIKFGLRSFGWSSFGSKSFGPRRCSSCTRKYQITSWSNLSMFKRLVETYYEKTKSPRRITLLNFPQVLPTFSDLVKKNFKILAKKKKSQS